MKIVLAVETIKPMLWCIREGFRWHLISNVVIETEMRSGRGRRSPHAFFTCEGRVTIIDGTAYITK